MRDHRRSPVYILALLTAILTFSYVDRYLIAVCVQPIKSELHLSDSALGLLTGFAFSAFYAWAGLPIARISDRGWRREVIGCSIAVWSAMTGLTGLVQNFAQMAIARLGVGAGEAGVFPTSQALISEIFPLQRRTAALAIFGAGGSVGLMAAFALGSWVETRVGWRWTFVLMGLPGMALSVMAFRYLPRSTPIARIDARRSLSEVLRLLWAERDFRNLPFAQSALVVLLFAQAQWLPAFFERSFAVDRAALGSILGLTQGVAMIAGMVLGGTLSDRLRQRDATWPLRLALLSTLAAAVPIALLYCGQDLHRAYVLATVSSLLFAIPAGPVAAHLQIIFGPELRASASAGALVIASCLGLGGGPFLIGTLSDALNARFGEESLRYALLITTLLAIAWAAHHLVRLLRSHSAGTAPVS
jgi:MFS transporter, Spinster family, sphingosine-1-phosphate transporter